MVKLKTIAEIVGVNISTVSKALRDSTDINYETKIKILDVAKQLNYPLKKLTKNNNQNNIGMIGVICPEITSDYYSQIISIIEKEIKKENYFLIIGFTNFESEKEKYFLDEYQSLDTNVSGIIFITESGELDNTLLSYRARTDIPMVMIAQNTNPIGFDSIKIDDDFGVKLAIEYLITSGHRKICYLGDELSNTRKDAFLGIMNANRIEVNEQWVQVNKERFEVCGYELMNNILKSGNLPTAVFGAYDDIAIGAMKAIYEYGLKIPDDISIIGIDNIRVSPYINPNLTTVAGPVEEMGRIVVKLLLKKIKDAEFDVVQNVKLSPRLIIRDSVKIIAEK